MGVFLDTKNFTFGQLEKWNLELVIISSFNPMVGDSLSSLVNVKMTKNTIFRSKIRLKLNPKMEHLMIREKIPLFEEFKLPLSIP